MNKFCSNCGEEIKSGGSFCSVCGKKISDIPKVEINNNTSSNNFSKSKIAAGILGIFLGFLGIHNFYLGYSNKGLAQLLITVLSCGIFSFVSGIWGFIEGILILTGNINTDAQGNILSD